MTQDSQRAARDGVVYLEIQTLQELQGSAMPFIRHGGLFIEQARLGDLRYDLGTDVFVVVHVVATDERIPIAGRVIWITPANAQRAPGIGIQFSESDGPDIRRRLSGE